MNGLPEPFTMNRGLRRAIKRGPDTGHKARPASSTATLPVLLPSSLALAAFVILPPADLAVISCLGNGILDHHVLLPLPAGRFLRVTRPSGASGSSPGAATAPPRYGEPDRPTHAHSRTPPSRRALSSQREMLRFQNPWARVTGEFRTETRACGHRAGKKSQQGHTARHGGLP
jgi:hypothetical protein